MTHDFVMEKLPTFLEKTNCEPDSVFGTPLLSYKGMKGINADSFLSAATS